MIFRIRLIGECEDDVVYVSSYDDVLKYLEFRFTCEDQCIEDVFISLIDRGD